MKFANNQKILKNNNPVYKCLPIDTHYFKYVSISSASHQSGVCVCHVFVGMFLSPVTLCVSLCWCAHLLLRLSFVAWLYLCVCVGQGSRHAAVCRPAVPVNGGTADDTTTADGGGPEVAGAGGKAAGNTHSTQWKLHSETQLKHTQY